MGCRRRRHGHLLAASSWASLLWRALAEISEVGFQNPYYQVYGYFGSRVLEHNQTDRFKEYVEATWTQHSVVDKAGRIWIVDRTYHQVLLVEPSGAAVNWPAYYISYAGARGRPGHFDGSRSQSRFDGPMGIVLCEPPGKTMMLYVADTNNHVVRRLDYAAGRVSTIAGFVKRPGLRDGPSKYARLNYPMSLGIDPSGRHLFVLDNSRRIRHISLAERVAEVRTLVDGACRSVSRWTVPGPVTTRRVGCHPDWLAKDTGDPDVDEYQRMYQCIGHQVTCGPRAHPALHDTASTYLQPAPAGVVVADATAA